MIVVATEHHIFSILSLIYLENTTFSPDNQHISYQSIYFKIFYDFLFFDSSYVHNSQQIYKEPYFNFYLFKNIQYKYHNLANKNLVYKFFYLKYLLCKSVI